jgi:protoporphyrinogen oxidase
MISTDVLVIGSGPTGLGAAVRLAELGVDHLVVESSSGPGGMASSVTDDQGFTWDLGGHVIHSHFACFDEAVAASGVPMLAVHRNGYVWTGGRLVPTPIQQHLAELPGDLRPGAPADNLAEYYLNNFGAGLAGEFFDPYTFKMWALPLDQIAHEWTSLRGGSGQRNVPPLGLAAEHQPAPTEFFPYPRGGTGQLWRGVHHKLSDESRFRFDTAVVGVDLPARVATLEDGTRIRFASCVSTVAITTAMGWTGIEPGSRPTGVAPLTSPAVYAIGLGFQGAPPPRLADKTYLHCPDAGVPWYRATVLSNYDPGTAGDGRWNVLCEVSTSPHRPIGLDEAVAGARSSLAALGAEESGLVSVWTRVLPMGYPVPTLGRDLLLRRADDVLRAHGVHSRGRFGGWRYESCNQDYSYAQGFGAVNNIVQGDPEDVYWHPERF